MNDTSHCSNAIEWASSCGWRWWALKKDEGKWLVFVQRTNGGIFYISNSDPTMWVIGKEGVETIVLPQIEWYRQRWNEAVFNGYSLVDKSKGA